MPAFPAPFRMSTLACMPALSHHLACPASPSLPLSAPLPFPAPIPHTTPLAPRVPISPSLHTVNPRTLASDGPMPPLRDVCPTPHAFLLSVTRPTRATTAHNSWPGTAQGWIAAGR